MQKHYVRFSWMCALCITLLSAYSANAALHYLPRYQANLSGRENTGGRDKTNLSCSQKGMYTKPSDSCSICIGEDQGCCASIECNKTKGCYAYDSDYADQNSCTLQGDSCYDTATHKTWYKTCVPETCMTEDNKDYLISHNSPGSTSCEEVTPGCWWCKCPEDWWLQEKCSSISRYTDGAAWTKFCYPLWDSTEKQRYMLECAAGYYLVNENNGCWHCLQCPSGKTSKPGAVGAESCKTCSAGYGYEGDPDKPCPSGTFSTKCGECKKCTLYQGWTAKKDAPEATTSREEACEKCPLGTYRELKAEECQPCPAGYEPRKGASTGAYLLKAACTVCPEGTYKASSGTEACTPCPTGTVAISGVTGATSQAQACGKDCIKCSTATYPLLTCPSHAVCEECTPKNCEDNSTRYKISYCEEGYKQSGNSCIAKTCEELGYLSSIPEGMTCTPITTTAGRCYTNCSNQYSTCQEWLNATGHNAIVVTGSFDAIVKQGKYDEILYSSDKEISSTYIGSSQQYNVTIAPASIYEQESGGLCKSAVKSLYLEDFSAYNSTVKIMDTKLRIDNLTSEGGVFNLVMSDDSSLEVGENISASVGSIKITGGSIVNDIGDINIQNSNYVNIGPDTSNNFFQGISIVGEDSSLSAKIVNVDDISLSQGASLNLTQARSIYDIYVSTILNYCSSCGISIGTPGEDVVIENGIRMEAPGDYNLTIYGNVSMEGNLDVVKSGVYAPEYSTMININGTLDMNNNDVLLNGGLLLSVSGHGKLLNPSSIVINLPPDSTYGAYDYAVELNEIYITVGNGGAIKMGGVCRMLGSDMFIRTYRNKCSCTSVIPSCYCPGNMTITSLSQMYNTARDYNGYPIQGTPLSSMGSSCSY